MQLRVPPCRLKHFQLDLPSFCPNQFYHFSCWAGSEGIPEGGGPTYPSLPTLQWVLRHHGELEEGSTFSQTETEN